MSDISQSIGDVANFATAVALGFTIWQYHREQKTKRRDEAINILNKYHDSEKMQIALNILDDYTIESQKDWKKSTDYYHKKNLATILRNHDDGNGIDDKGEIAVRSSFDVFLDFVGSLYPYLSAGVIKKDDIGSFLYYIDEAQKNSAVSKFANIYNFYLYKKFIAELYNKKS